MTIDQATKDEMFDYLDDLRESGETNMFGASPYLQTEFPELDKKTAISILSEWMKSFPRTRAPRP